MFDIVIYQQQNYQLVSATMLQSLITSRTNPVYYKLGAFVGIAVG